MKALEKVKDALKRKSKGQNVMVGLAIATISSVIIAISSISASRYAV